MQAGTRRLKDTATGEAVYLARDAYRRRKGQNLFLEIVGGED
jgi:hypothetical protein